MDVLKVLVTDILGNAAFLVGLFAMVGLLLQRKAFPDVFAGTVKTIVGFLIFGVGAAAAVASLGNFQTLFSAGFGIDGVLPISEGVTALALGKLGSQTAIIMVIGLVMNLIVARFTPMKYVFLTGQHNLFFAAILAIVLSASGASDLVTVLVGGALLGFFAAFFPWLCRNSMPKITGTDEIGIGHYVTVGYSISAWLGKKVGNPEQSTETIKLPASLGFFRDYVASIALTMVVFYYVATIAAGQSVTDELAGGTNWLVFPLVQALTFAAGVFIIITGVRMFLGEIVPAFLGISEKVVPGVKPALDCPAVFPYAPTAVILGFLCAYATGLLMMGVYIVLDWPVIIPVAIPYFFIGGTAAVFGNATGGWRGAVVGSAFVGVLISLGPQLIYPIMSDVGLEGSSFPETDFNIVGWPLYKLMEIGTTFGIVAAFAAVAALLAGVFWISKHERRKLDLAKEAA